MENDKFTVWKWSELRFVGFEYACGELHCGVIKLGVKYLAANANRVPQAGSVGVN